jgi:hypothetical protein
MKIPTLPMAWFHKKRKAVRARRERLRGADLAESYNNVDLADEEARRMVEKESLEILQNTGHGTGGSSKYLPSAIGQKPQPQRSASHGSMIDSMRNTLQRSSKMKGDDISDWLEESDPFECDSKMSLRDLMAGTGSIQQKGHSGMSAMMEQSTSFLGEVEDEQERRVSAIVTRSHKTKRASLHLTPQAISNVPELMEIVRAERVKEWASRFRRSDPRHQIMTYFDDVATLGINQITEQGVVDSDKISPILKMFARSAVFTVWRPTSLDSIKKMMLGQGVGKGLDIKGKSAKKGKLSGFVPFLQLYEDKHKTQIRTLPKKSAMRIFFHTEALRDAAAEKVADVGEEMLEGFEASQKVLADDSASDEEQERAMEKFMWEMEDPEIVIVDEYAEEAKPVFGMEIPERLFWEAFVMRQNIYREPGTQDDVGRVSHPSFQDMNFASLRTPPKEGSPRAVIYQFDKENPMDAKDLLVAYEENNKVVPVVSDFDCFLVGTRAVSYEEPIPEDQAKLVQWSCAKIAAVLDGFNRPESWTERWLQVLKEDPVKPHMPPYGFGDPKSYSLMELAVARLNKDGCVRHGAECFNYYFPQELDDHFLVIGEGMSETEGLPWKYVNVEGLQEILMEKINQGYTFPLNPKWVLCDPGWKAVYDALLASQASNVQDSLNCWYPPESGIREKIEEISSKYPSGFVRLPDDAEKLISSQSMFDGEDDIDGTAAMDLAEQELRSYETLRRAKRKLRAVLIWMSFIMDRQHEVAERKKEQGIESPEKKAGLSDGEELRKNLQPLLRQTMLSTMKHQELKIRDSLDREDVPKLLDRLKKQKSFISRRSASKTIPLQQLKPKSSLPAGTVSASVQGRYAGKAFRSSLTPLNDSYGSFDLSDSGRDSRRACARLESNSSATLGSLDESESSFLDASSSKLDDSRYVLDMSSQRSSGRSSSDVDDEESKTSKSTRRERWSLDKPKEVNLSDLQRASNKTT